MAASNPSPRPDEAARAAALKRTKRLATTLLVLAVAALVGIKILERRYAASGALAVFLGYAAAFAEAAAIGGLADWYAVVALFRHPLGLPIPHTAIIPANQGRIAGNLGRFIETQFLAPAPVEAKLREVDFAKLVADWMSDEQRTSGLADFVIRLLPQALDAVDRTGLKAFLAKRIEEQFAAVELAPLAAQALEGFTQDGRHQRILDELLSALHRLLSEGGTAETMREKIRAELPRLFSVFQADAYILRRLMNSAFAFISEVRADAAHPLRQEFDGFVSRFIDELRTSPAYAARAAKIKSDLLARPEIAGLAQNLWNGARRMIEADAAAPDSAIRAHLQGMFANVGRQLARDENIRADMNHGFVVALVSFVESQKSGVSAFIADQVKGWDMNQLVRVIELNIGRDLQYIRFNGMIIGGLAGVALHAVKEVLKV